MVLGFTRKAKFARHRSGTSSRAAARASPKVGRLVDILGIPRDATSKEGLHNFIVGTSCMGLRGKSCKKGQERFVGVVKHQKNITVNHET